MVPLLHNNPGGSPLGLRHPDSATEINVMVAQDSIAASEIVTVVCRDNGTRTILLQLKEKLCEICMSGARDMQWYPNDSVAAER